MSKTEREFHRKTAAKCFNRAWDYLEMKERSPEDDQQMLYLAHASRYHWGLVGTPTNRAVGEWQLSRVYADLGQPRLALQFAKASLSTCKDNNLTEIVHTANEAIARACAVARDFQNARKYLARAHQQLDKLALGREGRKIYADQIRDTQRLIRRT